MALYEILLGFYIGLGSFSFAFYVNEARNNRVHRWTRWSQMNTRQFAAAMGTLVGFGMTVIFLIGGAVMKGAL